MANTTRVEGSQLLELVDYVSARLSNLNSLRVTVGEAGALRVAANRDAGVEVQGTPTSERIVDPVDRLREIADQYRTGRIVTNPMDALREVVELLEPAYEQLLRS